MATITRSISFQKDDPVQAELLRYVKEQPMGFSPALRALAIIGMEVQKNGGSSPGPGSDLAVIVRRELQAMESRLSLAAGGSGQAEAAGDEIDDDLRDQLLAF